MTARNDTATSASECRTDRWPVAKGNTMTSEYGWALINGRTCDPAKGDFFGVKIYCDREIFEFESFHFLVFKYG